MSARTKPTLSQGTPREHGPHGVTLLMRNVPGPTITPVEPQRDTPRLRRPRPDLDGQRLVDMVGWRRKGRSPRKVLRVLRDMSVADDLVGKQGEYRNARRQARADVKGVV